jgi:hypothetical protein
VGRVGMYLLQLVGLVGILGLVSYISWTKMVLGAVLTIIGALFPQGTSDVQSGQGTLKFAKASVVLKGSLRIGIVLGGIILLIGAVLDGYEGYKEKNQQRALGGIDRLSDRFRSNVAPLVEGSSTHVDPVEIRRSLEAYEKLLEQYRRLILDQKQDPSR